MGGFKYKLRWVTLIAIAALCLGITNIDSIFKYSWGESIGWMNWHDANAGTQGAELQGTFLCGYVWGENIGWVNLGDGTPTNGTRYANANGTDFGVNVNTNGDLYGLAWAENIGWINFNTAAALTPFSQQARFDNSAGRLRGYAWAENAGWINLDESTYHVAVSGVQPVSIVQWRSVRSHNAIERAIVLNPSLSGNGNSGPTVETRGPNSAPGVQKVQVDFSGPVTLVNPGNIVVSVRVTTPGSPAIMNGPTIYTPTSVVLSDADTMNILFAVNQLPNMSCININIGPGTLAETLTGDTDCNIRSLYGDTNGSGTISISDQLATKNANGSPAATNVRHDLNLSDSITISDQLAVKSQFVSLAKTALCP